MCPSHRRIDRSFNITRRYDADGERSRYMETIGDRDHAVERNVFVPFTQPKSPKPVLNLSERQNNTEKNAFSIFQQEMSGKRAQVSQSPDKEKLRRISLAEEKIREEQEQAAIKTRAMLKDLRDLGNVTLSDVESDDDFPGRQFSSFDDQDQGANVNEDVLNMDFLKDIDDLVNPDFKRKDFADLTLSDIELDESGEGPIAGRTDDDEPRTSLPIGKQTSRLPQKGKIAGATSKFGLDRMKSKMPLPATARKQQKSSPPSKLAQQESKLARPSGIPGAQKRSLAAQPSTSKAVSSKLPLSKLPQKASTSLMSDPLDTSTKMPASSRKSGIKRPIKPDAQLLRQRQLTEQSFRQQASPPQAGPSGTQRSASMKAPYFQSPRPPPGKQQGLDLQLVTDKKNKIIEKYVKDLETSKRIKDPIARKQTINVLHNNLLSKLQKLDTYAGQSAQDIQQSVLAEIAASEEQNRAIEIDKMKRGMSLAKAKLAKQMQAKEIVKTSQIGKAKVARSTTMQVPTISIVQPELPEKSKLQAKKAQYDKMMLKKRQSLDPRTATLLESQIEQPKATMKTQELAKLRAKSMIEQGKSAKSFSKQLSTSLTKSGIPMTATDKQAISKLAKSQKLAIAKKSAKKTSDADKALIIAKAKDEFETQKEFAEQTIGDEDQLNQTLGHLENELTSKLHFINNMDKYKESVQKEYKKGVQTAINSITDKDILKEHLDFLREDSLNKTAYIEEAAGLPRQPLFKSQSAEVKEQIGDITYKMASPKSRKSLLPTKRDSMLPLSTLPAIQEVRRKSGLPKPRYSAIPGPLVAQRATMSPVKAAAPKKPILSLTERRQKAEEKYMQGVQAIEQLYKDDERILEAHRELIKGEYLATLAQLKEEASKQKAVAESSRIPTTGATMRTSLPVPFHSKGKLPIPTKQIPQMKRQSMPGKTGIPGLKPPALPPPPARKSLPMPEIPLSLLDDISPPPTPPQLSFDSITPPKTPERKSGPRGSLGMTIQRSPTQKSPHRRDDESPRLQIKKPATPMRSLQRPRPLEAADRSHIAPKTRTTHLRGTSVETAQLKTVRAAAQAWKMPHNTCATMKRKKMLETSLNELVKQGATNKDLLKTVEGIDKAEVPMSRTNIHPIAKYIGLEPGGQVEKVLEKANALASTIEERLENIPPTVAETMQHRDQPAVSPLAAEEADGIFKMMMHQSQGLDLTKEPTEIVGLIVPSQGPKLSLAGTGVESPSKGVIPDQIPLREITEISNHNAEEFVSALQQQPPHTFPQESIAVKRLPDEPIAVPSITEPTTREDYIQHDLVLHSFQVENFFQAKGSTFPDWFPGIYSVFPEEQPKLILKKTPSEVLLRAWQIMKPKIF